MREGKTPGVILFFVLIAVTVGVALVPGLALFAVIPGVLALACLIWLVLAFANGSTPGRAVRVAGRKPRLFGPGGADDPDRDL